MAAHLLNALLHKYQPKPFSAKRRANLEENKYNQGSKTEKENAIPTTEVKKEQAA